MADITNLSQFLSDVANAIRTKKETTEQIPAENFDTEILSIETGVDTSDATATASDIVSGQTAYVNSEKITGTVAEYPSKNTINGGVVTDNTDIKSITVWNKNSDDDLLFDKLLRGGAGLRASYTNVVNAVDLTPDKLVKGNTVLGVEGTAEIGTEINNQDKEITENGTYSADEGYTGLGTVTVNVPSTGDVSVKLFATEEEMQSSYADIDDIALVYEHIISDLSASDTNVDVIFPETVVTPSTVTSSSSLATKVSVNGIYIRLTKAYCYIGSTRTAAMTGSQIKYTSTDGKNYTLITHTVNTMFIDSLSSTVSNYLAFFKKQILNFGGLFKYDGTNWNYLDIGVTNLLPSYLDNGVTAYGNNGVVTGDGSIINNLRPSIIMNSLYGKDNIVYGDTDITTWLGETSTNGYAYLNKQLNNIVHIDTMLTENNVSILPIKLGLGRPLFDTLITYKRTPDNSTYYSFLSEDGKHGARFDDMTVIVDDTVISLPGQKFYYSSSYSAFVLKDYLYVFTLEGDGSKIGYITKISLMDGTYSTLSHSIGGSSGATAGTNYACVTHVYNPNNNRVYISLSTYYSTSYYGQILYFDLDFTSITLWKTFTTVISSGSDTASTDIAMTDKYELAVEMFTGTSKTYKLYLYDMDTLSETASCTYAWDTNGSILMTSTEPNGNYNKILWHIDNMLYSKTYGYTMQLDLSTGTHESNITTIDKDVFPSYIMVDDDLLFSDSYVIDTIVDEQGNNVYIHNRAMFDFTNNLVTKDDIKYTTTDIVLETGISDYPRRSSIIPYFNGINYKSVDTKSAIHKCGDWDYGTMLDYDALLIPTLITTTIKAVDGVRIDKMYTPNYMIVYNTNNTVSPTEYSTAITTANEILGDTTK